MLSLRQTHGTPRILSSDRVGVFVGLESPATHVRTISDVMIETMANWGVRWCFGMVGLSRPTTFDRDMATLSGVAYGGVMPIQSTTRNDPE